MKRSILIGLMCLVIALTGIMSAYAASPESGSTLETQVKYEAIKTDWLWSVPATQTFTDGSLTKTGDVSITPVNSGNVIILDEGTQMDININSANSFKLQNTNKSAIPYEVKKGSTVLVNNDNVLHFEAGVSTNTGVTQTLSFETTAAKIKEAKLTGQHTDVVTFNLDVQAPVPVVQGSATFNKYLTNPECHSQTWQHEYECWTECNDTLTWDELQLAENGAKYLYRSDLVTNNALIYDDAEYEGPFQCCESLISITIPNSVTSIGVAAFSHCNSLTSVTFEEGSQLTSIGTQAFYDCTSLTSINIPEGVTSIGDGAFHSCDSLTSVTIPDSVTSIGNSAFYDCSLTSITIPNSVTSIGNYAIYNCTSLTSINIPEGVTSIGYEAFCYCTSLTEINVDENNNSYSSIDGVLFNKDKTTLIQYPVGKTTTSYIIPDGVQEIGLSAFRDCRHLTNVTIPNSVTSIGSYAFSSCSGLTSITIPDSVTSIEKSAFECCGLTSITIPNGVTRINSQAFNTCGSLTSVTIPEGVTSIGDNVFAGCRNLTSVYIPNSMTKIEKYAFSPCESLTDIYYTGTQAEWNAIIFDTNWNRNTGNYTIHCTDGDIAKS